MQTEKSTYDAIVVGARCAGAPTAMLLARQGHRVLLVDRARFPSNKPISTHFIMRPGVAAIGRWGLLDRLAGLGAPARREYAADFGPVTLVSDSLDDGLASAAYGPRRFLLDKMLLEAAIESRIEFREDFAVQELIRDGERVVGVRGGAKGGALVEERAKIVVGADGLSSVVARETGAKRYHDVATKTGVWWGYFRGLPIDRTQIWFRPRRLFATISSDSDLTLVMAYIAIDDYHEFSANVEENFMNEYHEFVPDFYEQLVTAPHIGQWVGTGYQPNYFRESAGPGWALVGDAGRHHDSINPSGISKAFTEAEMLSEAVHTGLTDGNLDQAVRDYQTRRDARWLGHWNFAVWLASMEPPTPEFVALLGALATQPQATRRFFAFFEGQEAEKDFMAPENIASIVAGSA